MMDIVGISGLAAQPFMQGPHGSAGAGGSMGALVDRFNRLMETAPPPAATGSGMPAALTQFVHDQQSFYAHFGERVHDIQKDTESMNMAQMTLRSIELIHAVGESQRQFTAATALGQSFKSGLQTLMKNQ